MLQYLTINLFTSYGSHSSTHSNKPKLLRLFFHYGQLINHLLGLLLDLNATKRAWHRNHKTSLCFELSQAVRIYSNGNSSRMRRCLLQVNGCFLFDVCHTQRCTHIASESMHLRIVLGVHDLYLQSNQMKQVKTEFVEVAIKLGI